MSFITSNNRQIQRPEQPMSLILSSIIGGVNEQNCTIEMSIIASDVFMYFCYYQNIDPLNSVQLPVQVH